MTRRHAHLGLVAAGLLAAAGLAVVAAQESDLGCAALRVRLEEAGFRPTATQRWDDIYTLQEHITDGLRLRAMFEGSGCAP